MWLWAASRGKEYAWTRRSRHYFGLIPHFGLQAVLLQLNNESIAAAVWNAQTASHVAVGTFGKFIKSLLTTFKFLGLK